NPNNCPGGSLNQDGDTEDQVVHLWRGGARSENLGRAAVEVALSEHLLAARVSEPGEGTDLTGDGDAIDDVVQVHGLDPGASWVNVGQPADHVDVRDFVDAGGTPRSLVAFLTSEKAAGRDLNGDGDTADRVLQLYHGHLINTRQPAEEFVMGHARVVAFRTLDADRCGVPAHASNCTNATQTAGC